MTHAFEQEEKSKRCCESILSPLLSSPQVEKPEPLGVRGGEDANDHSWLVPAWFDSEDTRYSPGFLQKPQITPFRGVINQSLLVKCFCVRHKTYVWQVRKSESARKTNGIIVTIVKSHQTKESKQPPVTCSFLLALNILKMLLGKVKRLWSCECTL